MLICEFVTEVISSTAPLKIRIKHHDDSEISPDSAIFRIAEGQSAGEYLHLQNLGFSYGTGIENFDWQDFWLSASELNEGFIPLATSGGIATSNAINRLPYSIREGDYSSFAHIDEFNLPEFYVSPANGQSRDYNYIPSVSWENGRYGYSIIATLNSGLWDRWSSIIAAYDGDNYSDRNSNFWQSLGYDWVDLNHQSIDYTDLDDFNIIGSIKLAVVSSQAGFGDTVGTPSLIENIELEPQSLISEYTENSQRWVYKPLKFHSTNYIYDMRSVIYNYNMPTFIEEGSEALGGLTINTFDYAGQLEIYALDSNNLESLDPSISEELQSWYGEVDEQTIANYGNLQVEGSDALPYSITVERNQIEIAVPFSYVASNVNAGQTDIFTIFIKASQPDFSQYEHPQEAERQWAYYTQQEVWDFTNTIRIEVLDVNTEAVDVYDAGNILIDHPVDILHHLLYLECGYKGEIDLESKDIVKIAHPNWKMGFSVKEQIESRDLVNEICNSTKMTPIFSNDLIKFITIEDTYTGYENIQTINADDVLSYNFTRTPIKELKTQVEVKYQYDYGLDNFASSTDILKINEDYLDGLYYLQGNYGDYLNDNLSSYNYYGLDEDSAGVINHDSSFNTFETKYIRDRETANRLAEYLLMQNCNQHNIVRLTLPLKYYAVEVGDLIDFDKMILGKKLFGEKYVLDEPSDMPIRCGQYILPLFIITEVSKTLTDVEITAMQLHHLSTETLEWKDSSYASLLPQGDELGDVNGDGEINVLDIVAMVGHITAQNTLTGRQFTRADVNQDNSIDVLDIVKMVEIIVPESPAMLSAPANKVSLSYGNGNVEIENTGQVAGFEISYKGAIRGVKKLGQGWKVKIGDNKILIYSMGETEVSPLLFTYIGDFEVTSCKYANWGGTWGYTNINNLKNDTWNSSAGDFVADARKYEEVFADEKVVKGIKKSVI